MQYHFSKMTVLSLSLLSVTSLCSQEKTGDGPAKIPSGTPIYVQLDHNYPLRAGQAVQAHVAYPVYVGAQIALPASTLVDGHIESLHPALRDRRTARWNGDFTPLRLADVVFDQVTLPDGENVRIRTLGADQGVQTLRIGPTNAARHSIIRTQLDAIKSEVRSSIQVFSAPDKADRFKQILWRQLPWRPQRLDKDSEWSFELVGPVLIPGTAAEVKAKPASGKLTGARTLRAHLNRPISSRTDKRGSTVEATVLEPLYAEDKSIEVPQGSILEGTITEAKAARWLGRDGKLRFAFKSVRYPEGFEQSIAGTPSATSTDAQHPLTMDVEGGVKPAPKDRFLLPLLSVYLANSAMDQETNSSVLNASASNSFGLVGRVAGAAASSPSIAAGIGYYTAAREVYASWVARGRDVSFAQNTRIEISVLPRSGTSLSANSR
jgi:hypothetical protein